MALAKAAAATPLFGERECWLRWRFGPWPGPGEAAARAPAGCRREARELAGLLLEPGPDGGAAAAALARVRGEYAEAAVPGATVEAYKTRARAELEVYMHAAAGRRRALAIVVSENGIAAVAAAAPAARALLARAAANPKLAAALAHAAAQLAAAAAPRLTVPR